MVLDMLSQLEWEREPLATLMANMLGNIFGFIDVEAGQMIFQMISLHKALLTVRTFEFSFTFMSQIMFF